MEHGRDHVTGGLHDSCGSTEQDIFGIYYFVFLLNVDWESPLFSIMAAYR